MNVGRERSPAGRALARVLLVLVAGSALAGLGPLAGERELHPMDGPDVDCRIRIDADAVRFQVTMNLAYVDEVVDVGRELEDQVHPVEQPALEEALFRHYAETNRVTIDGVEVAPVRPVEDAFQYVPADQTLVPLFPRFGARALAKVRLLLDYPAPDEPERVEMRWGSYPPNETIAGPDGVAPPIEVNAQLRASGIDELVVFREDEPEVVWTGELVSPEERFQAIPEVLQPPTWDLPVPSVALVVLALLVLGSAFVGGVERRGLRLKVAFAGLVVAALLEPVGHARVPDLFAVDRALPDEEAAVEVFRPLQANIYRAFDYDEESDVYDALARSVEGPLLAELYGKIYASLVQEEAGGAVSRVRTVDVTEAEVQRVYRDEEDRPAFDVDATWRIEGVVFHWGHAHVRWNEYRALYSVRRGEAGWRIASSETLAERRIDAAPILPAGALSAEDGGPGFPGELPFGDAPFVLPEGEDL